MKDILLIAGTRPNFIKLAPLYHRLVNEASGIRPFICHTGQHFDFNMSDIFWQNLQLPAPNFQLNVKGAGVVDTIGKSILAINEVVQGQHFDMLVVFGDVNATAAGAIVGVQSRIPVIHVEAGLRSFDRDMPEEINRILTDHISDYLMVSEPSGIKNLVNEGFTSDKYLMVGNIMIECLLRTRSFWSAIPLQEPIASAYLQKPVVATFHRPENVDNRENLGRVVEILKKFSENHPVIFPVHPRTKSRLEEFGLWKEIQGIASLFLTAPLSYFEFLKIVANASVVITDSGGVQEETSFLNIPCITFRKNTERPVTVDFGTNMMMRISDTDYFENIQTHIQTIVARKAVSIPLWDDQVSARIVQFIQDKI